MPIHARGGFIRWTKGLVNLNSDGSKEVVNNKQPLK